MEREIHVRGRTAAMLVFAMVIVSAAVIAGWMLRPQAVKGKETPAAYVEPARRAGEELFRLTPSGELSSDLYTETFRAWYAAAEDSLPALAGPAEPEWLREPIVIWSAEGNLDLALVARTSKGVEVMQLRLTESDGAWRVAKLFSRQSH